jgi:SAM-dependent methyltransferase
MPTADKCNVSRELVVDAYRLILGRNPENEEAVRQHMNAPDLRQLRYHFFRCEEFRDELARAGILQVPDAFEQSSALNVELDVDQESTRRLLERVERCWTLLGKTQPHWSVVVAEEFKSERFDAHADAFYASGQHDVTRLFSWLARNCIPAEGLNTCLEFGCGTGRVTPWLAKRFQQLIACDISSPHLELTKQSVERSGCDNVEFVRTATIDGLDNLGGVDLVFSCIVLQHNPPPIIAIILRKLLQRLNPGGIAFFQVPTYGAGYRFNTREYLSLPENRKDFVEMHLIPQHRVFKIAEEEACSVIEVEPDKWIGMPTWISNTFLLQKRR